MDPVSWIHLENWRKKILIEKNRNYAKEKVQNLKKRCYVIPIFPSSAMHVPLCDYVLTPTESVGCHRNIVSDTKKRNLSH